MYSGAGARNARDTIREFEQVRGFFAQVFGGPPGKPVPVRLVTFGSAREYEPYRLNEYAIAYYHPTADRDYIVMSRGGADTFPIAVHEYIHLVVRHAGLNLPPWLNEGLAELYSTLRPMGNKILIGDLIAGRHQALLQEKWVPLATILAADRNSPYYNEKNKAGNLYNEGWALTHMLYFREEYRGKVDRLVRAISGGTDSATALTEVYGRPVAQIERDLQGYLRGSLFKGALVSAKLEKETDEIPVEALPQFDVDVVLADLMYRPGKEAAAQAAWERLLKQDPKRPESYRALGYLAWRQGHTDEARQQFGKAFERGERDPKMLWDYGRLIGNHDRDGAERVFALLLEQDSARMDVRLELAELQLRADRPNDALATIAPIRTVSPQDSARFFRIAVYAHLRNGDYESADATAKRFRELAKTDQDREAADLLVAQATRRSRPVMETVPVEEVADTGRPQLRRAAPVEDRPVPPPAPERLSASGRFVELDCRGAQARMVLETDDGRRTFLIEDPAKVAITAGSSGPVDLECGAQKRPVAVQIQFERPRAGQQGVDGIVRALAF
jgi:Flp pilus assembly protein TadD